MPRMKVLTRQQLEAPKQLLWFLVILAILSTAFYIFGPLIGSLAGLTNAELPGSALMFVVPTIAAYAVAKWWGESSQLWSTMRSGRTNLWVWAVVLGALPLVVFASSGGAESPDIAVAHLLLLVVLFIVAALLEELGWTSFVLPRLKPFLGELLTAAVIGGVCALWHVVPYIQNGYAVSFILGQCAFTVAFRFLLIRLTVVSRGLVWPAVIGHATYNVAWVLSPEAGALYNPWIAALLTTLIWAALYMARHVHDNRTPPANQDVHTV